MNPFDLQMQMTRFWLDAVERNSRASLDAWTQVLRQFSALPGTAASPSQLLAAWQPWSLLTAGNLSPMTGMGQWPMAAFWPASLAVQPPWMGWNWLQPQPANPFAELFALQAKVFTQALHWQNQWASMASTKPFGFASHAPLATTPLEASFRTATEHAAAMVLAPFATPARPAAAFWGWPQPRAASFWG